MTVLSCRQLRTVRFDCRRHTAGAGEYHYIV